MTNAKNRLREVLNRLPDDCSSEDVLCHIYVIQQVDLGLAEVEAGPVLPHEQVEAELRRKWQVGSAG